MTNQIQNMTEALQFANHASTQSDRWLFIVLLIAFAVLIKWMIQRDEKRYQLIASALESSQAAHIATIAAHNARSMEREVEMISIIKDNTSAMTEFTKVLVKLQKNHE